jgi:hypothetical protein
MKQKNILNIKSFLLKQYFKFFGVEYPFNISISSQVFNLKRDNLNFIVNKNNLNVDIKFFATRNKLLELFNSKTGSKNKKIISIMKLITYTKFIKNALFSLNDAKITPYNKSYHLKNIKFCTFCSNDPVDVLIPDSSFIVTNKYKKTLDNLEKLPNINSLLSFWVGNAYGLLYQRGNFLRFQIKNSDILKAFLCNTKVSVEKLNTKPDLSFYKKFLIKAETEISDRVSFEYMYSYLVQVDVDGVSNSWPGFFHKLYSGRPLLKIRSSLGYKQWYYDRLKPDYHFFDVKSDLSNFREKYYQALEEYKTTKIFPGREFISKMNYDEELQLAADKISFYFK